MPTERLNDHPLSATSLEQRCRHNIVDFLRKIGLSVPDFEEPSLHGVVEDLVRAEFEPLRGGDIPPQYFEQSVVIGIMAGRTVYGHTSIEAQVHMAILTTIGIWVDDIAPGLPALAAFAERFHAGREQLHPILDILAARLRRTADIYHAYGAAAIVTNYTQFVACTAMDKEDEGVAVHGAAGEYIVYKRIRNGIGEAFSFGMWDKEHFPEPSTHVQMIPESMTFLCYANDIFSFYKEELANEKSNFIHDRMRVTGRCLEDALMDTVEDTVAAVTRARKILRGEKERMAWEEFLQGYVTFHFIAPRYKLRQLLSPSI